MSKVLDISVIILCYNEELHIKRCLDRIAPFVKEVFLIDCFSKDKTCEIAQQYDNVQIISHEWPRLHAVQFNWALENSPVKSKWILRLDADEYLLPETIKELQKKLEQFPKNVTGLIIKRRHIFLDKWIKRGTYPVKLLRIFRTGMGRCEQRMMDEHIILTSGTAIELDGDFVDHNLNHISWWIHKHVDYAIREAADLLFMENSPKNKTEITGQALHKRHLKEKYCRQPLFWRAFAYFLYRYFFKLGFLEGKEGFCWHFFQGLWYRMFVDAKIFEIKKACGNNLEAIRKYMEEHYNISLK